MDLIKLHLPAEFLRLTDKQLGIEVRKRVENEQAEKATRIAKGVQNSIRKLGTAITIDGVTYLSRTQAMKALGLSFSAFAKKYPNGV